MGKGLWIALGATFLTAGAVGFGLYRVGASYIDFGGASSELPTAVAAYRRDGLPFLAREVAPRPLDAAHNAAPAIVAARAAMPGKKVDAMLTKELKRPGPSSDLLLRKDYAKPLALVESVADRPRVDFRRDWDLGPAILFPDYATMKTLAKAEVLRADRAAARGDDASALRDLTLARQLALWAGQEPCLLSMLVRIAAEQIALDGAERCLDHAAGHPERIARYGRWLRAAPPLPSFGDALRGEAWMGVPIARNFSQMGGMDGFMKGDGPTSSPDPKTLRRDGLPEDTTARAFLTRHLQVWDEAYRATDGFRLPPTTIGVRLDAISARLDDRKGLSYLLEHMLFPVFGQAGRAVVTLEAKRAVQLGFVEALTTHALTGRWPAHVSGVDPFTGGPLHVKRSASGFRVYSVGRDGKDDGGILRREAPKREDATYDEVAAYPPVPR